MHKKLLLTVVCLFFKLHAHFDLIEQRCSQLPTFKQLYAQDKINPDGSLKNSSEYKMLRFIDGDTFEITLELFLSVMQQELGLFYRWQGASDHLSEFCDITDKQYFPYAQKVLVEPDSTCVIKGNIYGDVHSLITLLKQLQKLGYASEKDALTLIDPNFKLIFLGNYVNFGVWSVEVFYLLMQLKIKNPSQVFLLRGNQEFLGFQDNALLSELKAKLSVETDPHRFGYRYDLMQKAFNFLPVVLYIGCKDQYGTSFLQCCQSGLEWGYNPKDFLNASEKQFERISFIKQKQSFLAGIPCTYAAHDYPLLNLCCDYKPKSFLLPFTLGFLRQHFVDAPDQKTSFTYDGGFEASKQLVHQVLYNASSPSSRLIGVVGAYQHTSPLLYVALKENSGCKKLWNTDLAFKMGSVFTLLHSPNCIPHTILPDFDFDTAALIYFKQRLNEWQLRVINY